MHGKKDELLEPSCRGEARGRLVSTMPLLFSSASYLKCHTTSTTPAHSTGPWPLAGSQSILGYLRLRYVGIRAPVFLARRLPRYAPYHIMRTRASYSSYSLCYWEILGGICRPSKPVASFPNPGFQRYLLVPGGTGSWASLGASWRIPYLIISLILQKSLRTGVTVSVP